MEVLCSPVNGKATMLENVHDEMFSEKMLGDGIAVIPDENELRSPVEGTVTMIYENTACNRVFRQIWEPIF